MLLTPFCISREPIVFADGNDRPILGRLMRYGMDVGFGKHCVVSDRKRNLCSSLSGFRTASECVLLGFTSLSIGAVHFSGTIVTL